MRPAQRALACLTLSLACACGDGADDWSEGGGELRAATDDDDDSGDHASPSGGDTAEDGEADGLDEADDLTVDDLDCVQDGMIGKIRVAFHCDEIVVVSCKDLSNVVLEFADGSRQRFEGLQGQRGVFSGTAAQGDGEIAYVWVKAGANHSGEGPGYGERFDAPTDTCTTPPQADCLAGDTTCAPPTPPTEDECFVADGTCGPLTPPPPRDEECFIADGSCNPGEPLPPTTPPSKDPSLLL